MSKSFLEKLLQVGEEVENAEFIDSEKINKWLMFLNPELTRPPIPQWQHIGNPSLAKQGEGVWTLWERNLHPSSLDKVALFDGGLLGIFNSLPTRQKIKSLTNQSDAKVEKILNGDFVRGDDLDYIYMLKFWRFCDADR